MHMGSLLAAVVSYLDARANRGKWLLRIDDLDTPRIEPSAEDSFYRTLRAHGLQWDGPVSRQSEHFDSYKDALQQLKSEHLTFYCTCTRSRLRGFKAYPGYCRTVRQAPEQPYATRVLTEDEVIRFDDLIQGPLANRLSQVDGDFVVFRKEEIPAYPLAVIVDDSLTGVNHVVRGSDLIDNTFNQVYLSGLLDLPIPKYAHLPVFNERDNIKLSKRHKSVAIDDRFAYQNLNSTFQLLGFDPPRLRDIDELVNWGLSIWDISRLPKQRTIENFISL